MEVVNIKKTSDFDVYGGRGKENGNLKHMNNTKVGNKGWIGNPYPLSEYSRQESIELFKQDFLERWENDEKFRNKVKSLAGLRVCCYCKPKDCHLDVVKNKLREEGILF